MTRSRAHNSSDSGAVRLTQRPWKDPRLLIGILLVLGATLAGARLAAAGDDRLEYWSVSADVMPGDPVREGDLRPVRVKLADSARDIYLRTDREFAAPLDQLVWAHPIVPGALVAKTSLIAAAEGDRGELPLNVAPGSGPVDLARGDVVDVWVGPGPGDGASTKAERVLERVRVLHAGGSSESVGGTLAQTVLVDVDVTKLRESVIATVGSGHVTLVRVS